MEANNWYFGNYAGISFKTSPPTALTDGPVKTLEGCATISDNKGNLLFSTDGSNVYDKSQKLMSNGSGLYGDNSSSQSGIVVKKPNSKNIYYIFTVNGFTSSGKGYYYSTIDITQNGGLGAVISKNDSLIYSTTSKAECITSTFHSNRRDVWVICYNSNKQEFASFLVTPSGVITKPVTSSFTHNGQFYYGKVSPNGTKYAVGSRGGITLADFNTTTGKLSNINAIMTSGFCYGIEFSPNSNLLYGGAGTSIFQFDISLSSLSLIINSKTTIATGSSFYGLQLGPDKQIWVARFDTALSVIPYPNLSGTSCQFYYKFLGLHKKNCQYGLPSFFQSYFDPQFNYIGQCFGDTAWFLLSDTTGVDSVLWNFGDPASAKNKSKGNKVFHLFSDTGEFKVKSFAHNGSLIDTTIIMVNQDLYLGRSFELGDKIYKCFDDTITLKLSASSAAVRVKWSNGSDSLFTKIRDSGYYSVKKYYGSKCYKDDSVKIVFYKNNVLHGKISLGNDLGKCPYDSLKLRFYDSNSTKYVWSTGIANAPTFVKKPSTISIKAFYGGSCYRTDTVKISNYTLPKYTLGPDTFYCQNESIWLGYFTEGFAKYMWSNGSDSPFLIPDSAGKYILEITDSNRCKQSDTINVKLLYPPKINLGKDTIVCNNSSLVLDAKNYSVFTKYKWGTNVTKQTDTAKKTGKYWVRVTNACGISIDTVAVKFLTKPKATLPKDSIFCNTVTMTLDGANTNNDVKYAWNTKATTQTITANDTGIYKLIVTNACGKDSASTHFLKYLKPVIKPFIDTTFCSSFSMKLKIGKSKNGEKYSWNDLTTQAGLFNSDSIYLSTTGKIEAVITNKCGEKRDTFLIKQLTKPKLILDSLYEYCGNVNLNLNINKPLNEETYHWSTAQTTAAITISTAGKYWVKATNYCGKDSMNFITALYQKPSVKLGNDTTYCGTLNRILNATFNSSKVNYLWFSGQTTPTLLVNTPGMYGVTVSNFCGSAKDSINLSFYKIPNPQIGPDQVFCDYMPPSKRVIKATNSAETYQWSTGGNDTIETFTTPGKYWVKVNSPCGIISDTVDLKISKSPAIDLGKDTSLCGFFQYILDAQNPGMQYSWLPNGETTQTIIAQKQTTYKVTITSNDGCTGKGQITINGNCISQFWFPNSFTPNTDQLNETFKPTLINFENYEMRIFNRWGELLFETTDIEKGWDGTFKGKLCQSGVYYYVSNFISTENNSKQLVKGTITLLK